MILRYIPSGTSMILSYIPKEGCPANDFKAHSSCRMIACKALREFRLNDPKFAAAGDKAMRQILQAHDC